MMFGVQIHEIDKTIRTAINGTIVSKFSDKEGKEYNMVMRLPFDKNLETKGYDKIYDTSVTSRQIPLGQFATVELEPAPGLITHYNKDHNSTLTTDIDQGYSLDEVVETLKPKLESYNFPDGYGYKFTGELQSRDEHFYGMAKISMIAIIAIFAVRVL
jgi:multidrug efflux pump subunit AcrB